MSAVGCSQEATATLKLQVALLQSVIYTKLTTPSAWDRFAPANEPLHFRLQDHRMQAKNLLSAMLLFLVAVSARCLHAQESATDAGAPEAASGSPSAYVAPYGVPLAPPIYFVNFLLLYFSNPETAAYMPA